MPGKFYASLIVLLLITSSIYCSGENINLIGLDYDPWGRSSEKTVETSHTEWLNPNSKGPIRVLFITFVEDGGVRIAEELAQRIEMEYDVFAMEDRNTFFERGISPAYGLPEVSEDMLRNDLREKLQGDHDLIIAGNINWQALPSDSRLQILRKIREGTSLLGIVRNADSFFERAVQNSIEPDFSFVFPYKGLSSFENFRDFDAFINGTLEIASFGKGKIFQLKGYRPPRGQVLAPGPAGDSLLNTRWFHYDYYLSYLCQLINYAAGRQPDIVLEGENYINTDRGNLRPLEFVLRTENDRQVEALFSLRNDYGEIVFSDKRHLSLNAGENVVAFDTGQIPAGSYFGDIRLKGGNKFINFGSSFLELTTDTSINSIDIRESYKRNEAISGNLSFSGLSGSSDLKAKVSLVDNYNRVAAKKLIPVESDKLYFSVDQVEPITIIQYLQAELIKDGDVLDKRRAAYSIRDMYPGTEDLRFVAWGGIAGSSYPDYLMLQHLSEAGFDTMLLGFWNEHFFRRNVMVPLTNMHIIPYATRMVDRGVVGYGRSEPRGPGDHERDPCLTHPEYRKTLEETLPPIVEWNKKFSTMEYSMGDENYFAVSRDHQTHELCFSPTCIEFYHEWLKEKYNTIDNLNDAYNSDYDMFEELQPVTLKNVEDDPGLIPQWVDFRKCMEKNWVNIYKYCKNVIRDIQPEAKIGYEGSDHFISSFAASDFYKLMQALQLNNTYSRPIIDAKVRDFSQQGDHLGLGWFGGYVEERSVPMGRFLPWRHLLRGANSLWVYRVGPGRNVFNVTASDFSFHPFFQATLKEVEEMKQGIGKLLISSEREHDGIAVLYSPASIHSAVFTPELPTQPSVLDSLANLMEDTRHQFKMVASKQIQKGILQENDFKVLILPYIQSVTESEAEKIAGFVENGGVVISDLRPGVFNELGQSYPGGILDKIFGVEQSTRDLEVLESTVNIDYPGFEGVYPKTSLNGSLRLTSGKAYAEGNGAPAMIVNSFGRGKGILLNFSLSNYPNFYYSYHQRPQDKDRTEEAVRRGYQIRNYFNSLMKLSGIKRKAEISPDLKGVRMYSFKSGEVKYVGFLQELAEPPQAYARKEAEIQPPADVTIKFTERNHLYDIRNNEYLGFTDKFNTSIQQTHARLFALVPYKANYIRVDVQNELEKGSSLYYSAELNVSGGAPQTHIFRTTIISPEGEEMSHYAENVKAKSGKYEGKINFAYNDIAGIWEIIVEDVATGTRAKGNFTVR